MQELLCKTPTISLQSRRRYGEGLVVSQAVSRRLASYSGGPGSSTNQVMWDLWRQSGSGEGFHLSNTLPLY